MAITTVEQYLTSLPASTYEAVQQLRAIIKKAAPQSEEGLSYGIGGFKQNGKYFIYYSGYKKHTSIYPAPRGHEDFEAALSGYKGGKGTVQFPVDQPLPVRLIQRIVTFRLKENQANAAAKKQQKAPKKA